MNAFSFTDEDIAEIVLALGTLVMSVDKQKDVEKNLGRAKWVIKRHISPENFEKAFKMMVPPEKRP